MTFILTILLCQTDLTLVVSCEPHCKSVAQQWNAQNGLYAKRFEAEYKYINQHFRVSIVDEIDYPRSVSYPIVRFGRGGENILLKRMACYPGHFPMALYDICKDYRFELEQDYKDWQCYPWGRSRPVQMHVASDWAFVPEPAVWAPDPPRYDDYENEFR